LKSHLEKVHSNELNRELIKVDCCDKEEQSLLEVENHIKEYNLYNVHMYNLNNDGNFLDLNNENWAVEENFISSYYPEYIYN
jgi:tRNA splicing ligase